MYAIAQWYVMFHNTTAQHVVKKNLILFKNEYVVMSQSIILLLIADTVQNIMRKHIANNVLNTTTFAKLNVAQNMLKNNIAVMYHTHTTKKYVGILAIHLVLTEGAKRNSSTVLNPV